ncbi:MAG: EFR1 family ferrodoxin [Candidatus Omnitrophica bacterium]|nr:EFR1 family ferrodoxin [Candidatus Omnitrophota bacterium]
MSTAIYYFSATGNSLVVAKDVAWGLEGVSLIPVSRAIDEGGVEQYDKVGLVFPVYMFGLPLIIKDFLKEAKFKPGAYIFSIATFGGMPGRVHSLARKILNRRGIDLACGFSVMMPGNYTPLYGAVSKEQQEEMFRKEKVRAKELSQFILEGKRGIYEEKPFLANLILYSLIYNIGSLGIPGAASGFWVKDTCIKCGLCAKVCPVDNIEMRDGKPYWFDHCQHCMACLQWCPAEAIQYKKSTEGRRRYHHPEIAQEDIRS